MLNTKYKNLYIYEITLLLMDQIGSIHTNTSDQNSQVMLTSIVKAIMTTKKRIIQIRLKNSTQPYEWKSCRYLGDKIGLKNYHQV